LYPLSTLSTNYSSAILNKRTRAICTFSNFEKINSGGFHFGFRYGIELDKANRFFQRFSLRPPLRADISGRYFLLDIIVAVNKNPEASIFNYADVGIVGNIFTVLPIVIAYVKCVLDAK
jgi:hypothetical protein